MGLEEAAQLLHGRAGGGLLIVYFFHSGESCFNMIYNFVYNENSSFVGISVYRKGGTH